MWALALACAPTLTVEVTSPDVPIDEDSVLLGIVSDDLAEEAGAQVLTPLRCHDGVCRVRPSLVTAGFEPPLDVWLWLDVARDEDLVRDPEHFLPDHDDPQADVTVDAGLGVRHVQATLRLP